MPHPSAPHDPTPDDFSAAADVVDLGAGPWRSAFAVWIPGRVRSKSNYRHDKKAAWSELAAYDEAVYLAVRQHLPASWTQPADNSLPASLRGMGAFTTSEPAPASPDTVLPVVVHLAARTLLDTGNVSKSVLDALEGLLYANDAHVAAASEHVVRTKTGQGLLASFAQLDPDADYWTTADAHVALQVAVNDALRRLLPTPQQRAASNRDDCAAARDAHPAGERVAPGSGPDTEPTTSAPGSTTGSTIAATNEELIRA